MVRDETNFKGLMQAIYPGGLAGKSFLDSACNCGAYSFWMADLGATRTFGFDARDKWIDQANFLKSHRAGFSEGCQFQVSDLYALPRLGLSPFDITLFKGIFYHLPDPIGGLRLVADLTRELLIVGTATRLSITPGLVLANENVQHLMSGIHGTNWFPTSPRVVQRLLMDMGFKEFRTTFWHKLPRWKSTGNRGLLHYCKNLLKATGRTEVLAARTPGFFEHLDRSGFTRRYDVPQD
ncbi:MAG: hypothetical protein AMXMBFR33_42920 [Candidatus Xenobia bacterium]